MLTAWGVSAHRCWVAYERQGRHASARPARSATPSSGADRRTPGAGEGEHLVGGLRDRGRLREQVGQPGDAGVDRGADGGDVLTTQKSVMIGLSARTNREGAEALIECLAKLGRKGEIVETPKDVLHFKTDCSLLDVDTILATRRLSVSGCFAGYRVIDVPEGEEAAANTIRFNDLVLMPAGFPGTRAAIEAAGFTVREIGNSECAKLDGGMSCLSLRFTPK